MSKAAQSAPDGQADGRVGRLMQGADRLQRRRPVLSVAVAMTKKFAEERAWNLAALIAYYAFASMFPLLLIFVTVLDLVLRNDPKLREQLLDSALSQYPVIGDHLKANVQGLSSTGLALGLALLVTLYAARGVAVAMQNAVNTIWGVPVYRRPRFPRSLARNLGLIAVIGPGMIATITLSSVAGGTGHLSGAAARVAATGVSLVLNIGLFWLGFRIATAPEVASRDLRLSAVLSATGWQALQLIGGYLVGHQLATKSVYGAFGIVLGLLAWFYLQAQLTLFLVELNVVRSRRLWPRSLAPPLTEADLRAYQLYAHASQRSPDFDVEVRQRAGPPDRAAPDKPQ
jgi:membrane protein